MLTQYGPPAAVACMRRNGELCGRITFTPCPRGVLVLARIYGLPKSETDFFALHIHEGADCGGEGFSHTAGHYNPKGLPHPQHAGDLPPLLSCDGEAYLAVITNRFSLRDIIGKTVVIHSHPDDFKTQPAGDAGNKIACGVIRRIGCGSAKE